MPRFQCRGLQLQVLNHFKKIGSSRIMSKITLDCKVNEFTLVNSTAYISFEVL